MSMFDSLASVFRGPPRGAKEASKQPDLRVVESAEPAGMPEWAEKQKAKEEQLWGPGEWENVSRDLEAFLPPEIARVEVVNVGDPEIKGFKRSFTGERFQEKEKVRCEDRKINDPKHGLFAVLDGVSTARGDYKGAGAAEITARVVQSVMGENLDSKIRNIIASGNATEEMIGSQVATAMQEAVRVSQEGIEKATALKRLAYEGTMTTLSLAKLVALPEGKLRMYYMNIGDSRIQLVEEDGSLTPLTEDDNLLNAMASTGNAKISPEQIDQIDQFVHQDTLTSDQRHWSDMRSIVTRSVEAMGKGPMELRYNSADPRHSDILFVDLKPGQRVVITSDGVHDNSLRTEMAQQVKNADVRGAERALQEGALAVQKDQTKADEKGGRGKPDDIAAVVFEAKPPERIAAEPASRTKREYDPGAVSHWQERLRTEKNMPALERANLEYWVAKASLDDHLDRKAEFDRMPSVNVGDTLRLPVPGPDGIYAVPMRVTGFRTEKSVRKVATQGDSGGSMVTADYPESTFSELFGKDLEKKIEEDKKRVGEKAEAYAKAEALGRTKKLAEEKRAAELRAATTAEELRNRLKMPESPGQRRMKEIEKELADLEQRAVELQKGKQVDVRATRRQVELMNELERLRGNKPS